MGTSLLLSFWFFFLLCVDGQEAKGAHLYMNILFQITEIVLYLLSPKSDIIPVTCPSSYRTLVAPAINFAQLTGYRLGSKNIMKLRPTFCFNWLFF